MMSFHLKLTDASCTDDARVNVLSFQKSHFSTILNISHRRFSVEFLFV